MSGWLFIHSKYICSSKLGTEIYYEGVQGMKYEQYARFEVD